MKGVGKVKRWPNGGSWLCSDLSAVPLNIGFQPAFPHASHPPLPTPPLLCCTLTCIHLWAESEARWNPKAHKLSEHDPSMLLLLLPLRAFTVAGCIWDGVTIVFLASTHPHVCSQLFWSRPFKLKWSFRWPTFLWKPRRRSKVVSGAKEEHPTHVKETERMQTEATVQCVNGKFVSEKRIDMYKFRFTNNHEQIDDGFNWTVIYLGQHPNMLWSICWWRRI